MGLPPTPSDETLEPLCRRLQASDRSAFEQVFRLLREGLLRYVQALVGDGALAHDLVQDVFLDLWSRRETLSPGRPLRPYIYRMARNRALRHLRDTRTHARKEAELQYEMPSTTAPHEGPDAALDAEALREQIGRWLAALPDRQREALVLSRFHQLSHREVAAIMDVSPRTVNNHIVRALAQLQRCARAFDLLLWNP
ncbi:MAG: RNA polymerase sigma factor [Rhodothermales bacterium]